MNVVIKCLDEASKSIRRILKLRHTDSGDNGDKNIANRSPVSTMSRSQMVTMTHLIAIGAYGDCQCHHWRSRMDAVVAITLLKILIKT